MNILVIAPTYRETEEMLNIFKDKMGQVISLLKAEGHLCEYCFLSDGQVIDLADKVLIKHESPLGLATTLIEGYEAAVQKKVDIIVRIDTNENDPFYIPDIVKRFERNSDIGAVFCPMIHMDVSDDSLPLINQEFNKFTEAILNWNESEIIRLYNNVFPMGYHVFSNSFLQKLLPLIREGYSIFERLFGQKPSWGLDLLIVLISAKIANIEYYFKPVETLAWKENKSEAKSREQADRAQKMIQVARLIKLSKDQIKLTTEIE